MKASVEAEPVAPATAQPPDDPPDAEDEEPPLPEPVDEEPPLPDPLDDEPTEALPPQKAQKKPPTSAVRP